jgi:6-phosphogluconolactonase
MGKVKVFDDIYKLSRAAGEFFITTCKKSIREQGRFAVAFSGGATPESLYALLATDSFSARIEWDKVHVFWGDERCVPPNDVDSNFRMAKYALLDHVPLPKENIHRILGERQPDQAAAEYDTELRAFFGGTASLNPRFDLVLLGMGADGHTASLFPHTAALEAQHTWVVANYVDEMHVWRITLTPSAINAAANVVFLVSGSSKANRLKQVLEGRYQPQHLPAQLIQPRDGNLLWLIDREAAEGLDQSLKA